MCAEETCKRKRRYEKKSEAEVVRLSMRLRIGIESTRRLCVYRCEVCGDFHVGNGQQQRKTLDEVMECGKCTK